MKKLLIIVVFSMLMPVSLIAQEEQKDDVPYWYVASHKIPWDRVDSLRKMVKKYTVPIVAESKKSGRILDYNLLIHHTGDEYNVVIMIKYPSWAAMGEGPGFMTAFKALVPEKEKQDEIMAAFMWIYDGYIHKDNIYVDGMHNP